ncbi:uncharacterized protein LOC131951634 [Physella acuta]|uniref:uncharacterized protein LOC131951634 n=1 Tax=Physella acuta TaxID=109671 RepID=UPI0027DB0AAC|nr:uncharacterized protein LOC131951634 [Physella acuta]
MPIASQNRQLNKIQFSLPSSPPLTQWNDIDESTFCNATTLQGQDCTHQLCACVHVVSVATGQLVEMVFVNEGMGELTGVHPVHLHGYSFRVVAMGLINSNATVYDVEAMDNAGEITRRTKFAPLKDTVIVPPSGYTIVRFKADNPGVWMLHCHFEFHVVEGMALLLKVGQPEEWARAPEGFPKCGHWNIQ